jgi:hypothetical protein
MVQTPKELPPIGMPAEGQKPGTSQPIKLVMPPSPQPRPGQALPQLQPRTPTFSTTTQAQVTAQMAQPKPAKEFHLPKIEPPMPKERNGMTIKPPVHEEELKRFEEAINKINIDIIHTEPTGKPSLPAMPTASGRAPESGEDQEKEEYYHPHDTGEGYFSEIEHYIKHKDVNEIIDDVLKKDFLTDMKDYHDSKAQGRQFFLHKQDLKDKLQKKMESMRSLEGEWHRLKMSIEENTRHQKELEKQIDSQSQELKELFRQVRHTQWLEQEAPKEEIFRLRSGEELKSLNELRKALSYMTDDEFSHHVNAERNDFAAWARQTLKKPELAEKISKAGTKEELQAILQSPA